MSRFRTFLRKVAGAVTKAAPSTLSGVSGQGGRWFTLFDSDRMLGDWQRDIEVDRGAVLGNWAVFACITLIASDVGKLCLDLVDEVDDVRQEVKSPAFSPVLRKPNRYQTRQKFIEQWLVSKLTNGNTYVLKERDARGVVIALYVLDPCRVEPLVSESGDVYYRLQQDNLAQVPDSLPAVPASEIIHDTMVCLYHPLVGISPIHACGLAATQGLKIQQNSAKFFTNMSRPSGVLTAPGQISDETAGRLKENWEKNFTGDKIGRVAVLGDGLKYEAMTVNAIDAQLVEQLKLSAEMVCSTFHVPPFKIGIGAIPAGQKVEDLNQIYYSDCLQALMESIEALLDEGLGLVDVPGHSYGVEFDLDDLLKMDSTTQTENLKVQVGAGIRKIDEARAQLGLPPTPGGDTPYLQQQNYSLAALAKRDSSADPFGKTPAAAPTPAPVPPVGPDPTKAIQDLIDTIKATPAVDLNPVHEVIASLAERLRQADLETKSALEAMRGELQQREQKEQVVSDLRELERLMRAEFETPTP